MPVGYRRCPSCGGATTNACCGNPLATMMQWDAIIHGNPEEFLVASMMGGGVGLVEGLLLEEMFDGDDGDGGGFFG